MRAQTAAESACASRALAQRLRGEEVLGGVKLEARRDRRQLRQPLDRFDTGADVAFPFSSGDPSRGVRRDRVGATS